MKSIARHTPWTSGEVKRHCARCEVEVERLQRFCHVCSVPLRKECPNCHYWVEMDAAYCVSCHHAFPPPPPPKAVVRMWHPDGRGPI